MCVIADDAHCETNSSYVKKLQDDIKAKKASDPKTEEEKLKVIGLKTTSNIQTLIRDLFHSPPSFKSVVRLSWVTPKAKNTIKVEPAVVAAEEKAPLPGAKRHAPITFSNGDSEEPRGPKQAKAGNGQQMYSPPTGKFSSKFNAGKQGGNFGNRQGRNGGGNNRFRSGGGGGNRNKNFRRK